MRKHILVVVTLSVSLAAQGCGSSSTLGGPSGSGNSTAPPTSSLVYSAAAGVTNGATSGNYTTANASFGGNVRTTCVVNPMIAGSYCPTLQVVVKPLSETFCQFFIDPPTGEALTPRVYSVAQRLASPGVAGFSMNCATGGTTCNWSVGQFTLYELQADVNGVVTRLHVSFEQTCSNTDGSLYGSGKAVGELWIINGTKTATGALFP